MSEYEEIHGDTKYSVVLDNGYHMGDVDFPCEEEELDYMRQFETGELTSYGIITAEFCKCCEQWKEVDSLWSCHFESAQAALKDYLANYLLQDVTP